MHTLSALELRNRFLKKELTATAIATHFLKRIETLDPKLGAFLEVYTERTLQKAKALDDAPEKKGKLAAIPIALKDNIHVKEHTTTCGSKFLSNYKAPFDATVTRLLEEEGALIIGKTNLDEFAMGSALEYSAYKQTYNPWDLTCTPGGSSGGSAVAVAARMCPIALGSDTGGSIRQPASFCGVFGMKPTYGRVSRYGLVAFASSLDQIGPFTHHPEDLPLIMETLSKQCPKDSTSVKAESDTFQHIAHHPLTNKVIGVPYHLVKELPKHLQEIFLDNINTLENLGVTLIDINLKHLKHSVAIYYILATAEASTNLARYDGIRYGVRSPHAETLDQVYEDSKEEGFGTEVKRRILLGTYVLSSGYQEAYYKKAQKVRALVIKEFHQHFQQCDALAMPVTPSEAFPLNSKKEGLEMYLADTFTIPANLAGLPAVSVPAGFTKENKPVGIQFIGPQMHDQQITQIAYNFAKATHTYQQSPI